MQKNPSKINIQDVATEVGKRIKLMQDVYEVQVIVVMKSGTMVMYDSAIEEDIKNNLKE